MAKDTSKDSPTQTEAPAAAASSVNIQLLPSGTTDQPLLANVVMVKPTGGVALLDFGFLDPAALGAVTRLARAGRKIPEQMNGRLCARVALSYDTLLGMHRDIGTVLKAISKPPSRE